MTVASDADPAIVAPLGATFEITDTKLKKSLKLVTTMITQLVIYWILFILKKIIN